MSTWISAFGFTEVCQPADCCKLVMVVKLDVTNKQKGLSLVIFSALTPVCECVYKMSTNVCACAACFPVACPLTETSVRQSHSISSWPFLRHRHPQPKCCPLPFALLLSVSLSSRHFPVVSYPSFHYSLDFPPSTSTLVSTFYVSFPEPPSLPCSLHLSFSLTVCDIPSLGQPSVQMSIVRDRPALSF